MPKWEDITSSLKKGVSFVESKSKRILALTHLNSELNQLRKEREEKIRELGEKIYQLVLEGKFSSPEANDLTVAISEFERKIAAKKEEIDKIRNAVKQEEKKGDGQAEERDSGICGHEIPEGANFCPVCGKKLTDD